VISQPNAVSNKYLFAGEQFDANLGDYYLRQRYYNTQAGTFTRRDTYEGKLDEPLTLHKYAYTHNNPVNATDPTGLFPTLQEFAVASVIASILASTVIGIGAHTPAIIAGTRERHQSDDVVVYTGTGTVFPLTSPFGHAFIEVDGEIYTFPPSKYLPDPAPRDTYLHGEQTRYGYEYNRYSINYNAKEKQQLKANLANNRRTSFRNDSDYGLITRNCTNYVTASLPSINILFDAFVKTPISPSGLGWGLDVVGASQRNIVRRLSKVQRLPGTEWKFG
jgi:RHS repeat-associated protein